MNSEHFAPAGAGKVTYQGSLRSDSKRVLDVTGRVLYTNYLSGDQSRISLNHYAAGTYLLRLVKNDKNVKTQKIVIY